MIHLKCDKCKEHLDTVQHVPMLLPCGDTFCNPCVQAMFKDASRISCPKCRGWHLKPHFKKNFALITVIENMPPMVTDDFTQQFTTISKCFSCDGRTVNYRLVTCACSTLQSQASTSSTTVRKFCANCIARDHNGHCFLPFEQNRLFYEFYYNIDKSMKFIAKLTKGKLLVVHAMLPDKIKFMVKFLEDQLKQAQAKDVTYGLVSEGDEYIGYLSTSDLIKVTHQKFTELINFLTTHQQPMLIDPALLPLPSL